MRSWWLYGGLIGFAGYVPGLPGELRLLSLLFLYPVIRTLLRSITGRGQRQGAPAEPAPPRLELPIAPAAGGPMAVMLRSLVAQIAMLVSPVMWPQIARQASGQTQAQGRAIDSAGAYQQRVRYRLPFADEWIVVNGGIAPAASHSWDIVAQRYAYDFVIVDAELRRWRTTGRGADDYLCYGVPILAPADGVVVAVRDGVRDAPGAGTGWLDVLTPHFPGNSVTIQHAEGEYSFLAHLIPGSITVAVGDPVTAGQPIGRCGSSGHSTEPHLHFHVQDRADFWTAAGLPIAFDGVSVDGQPAAEGVYLVRGTRVRPSARG